MKVLLQKRIYHLTALLTSILLLVNSLVVPTSASATSTGQLGSNPVKRIMDIPLKTAGEFAVAAGVAQVPLDKRHPQAGVYPVWSWWIKPEELSTKYPYLEGQHLFVKWSDLKPTENGSYQWNILDTKVTTLLGTQPDKVLYLQANAEWPNWVFNHVAKAKFTERGKNPPQFWDPVYINLYKQFIQDLGQHVAQSNYRDKILLVRAQYNAFNPESITPWNHFNYTDYQPTSSGHIHSVNFTREIGNEYARQIVKAYLDVFKPLEIIVATKPHGATENDYRLAEEFANMGAGFFSTNSGPNPITRNETLRLAKREARIRSYSEPYNSAATWDNSLQWIYWQTLADLHQGVEFISYYGDDFNNPAYAGIFGFAEKYAGWYREPQNAPGAWIALRGVKNPPDFTWGGGYLEGNYEYLISQIEPDNSISLFGYSKGSTDEADLNPQSKPVTYLGLKSQKEGIWARQTNGQPLYLNLNDTFAASLGGEITLKVSYFDSGQGKFQVKFNDRTGQLQTRTFQKSGSQLWKEATITLNSYQFSNNLEKNADILLHSAGDDEDIFHMVEIVRLDATAPPPTQTPPATVTPTVSPPLPEPTDEPTPGPTVEPTSEPTDEPTPDPTFSPITLTLTGPAAAVLGETVAMEVEAQNVTGDGLYGVQFEVNYDPTLIAVNNLQVNPDFSFILISNADNIAGKIKLVASRQGNVPGLSGTVNLLTFEVTVVEASGTATFSFENELVSDRQAQGVEVVAQSHTLSIEDTDSSEPTSEPTPQPTDAATPVPTDQPSLEPTPEPTGQPTTEPTAIPTSAPTEEPTPAPTAEPTPQPTGESVAALFGQIILTGQANSDWSDATLTVEDGTYTVNANEAGHFTITDMVPGSYTAITADAPGYLAAVCNSVVVTPPETMLVAVTLLSGDINDDDRVDVTDATTIGVSFGATGLDLPPDINQDQVVNIFDIVLITVNFGQGAQTWNCQAE